VNTVPGGPGASPRARLPGTIHALGVASLCMDASSELVHAILPLYLTLSLGIGVAAIGVIEGVAEATAAVVKVFSGALSDRIERRKPVVVGGYALSALAKPLFPLAGGVGLVVAARWLDRIGKGIRGAPRDALIADVVPPAQRGAAYGLRQALDSVGACIGPLLALGLMVLWTQDLRLALWVAVIPGLLAVAVLVVFVREPPRMVPPLRRPSLSRVEMLRLPRRLWLVAGLGALLTLARFSDAFLVLRGQSVGLPLAWVPVVMVLMNAVYAAASAPAGALADRRGTRALLGWGTALLVASHTALAAADGPVLLFAGAILWGLHLALTQGLLAKLVAGAAPQHLRGTAFGVFHLITGVALLVASALAGWLWEKAGPAAPFAAGTLFALVAGAGLALVARRQARA
jgi:MFS family permease